MTQPDSASVVTGCAYYCGDCVNTDVMSPGRFEPYEGREQLARVALIDYEGPVPFVDAATGLSPYTVVFAGHEFGCGSSRETAPQALAYAGAKIVIARSFARIFFRNCVNMGLLFPIVHDHPFGNEIIGQEVSVNLEARRYSAMGKSFEFADLGPLTKIVAVGGLTNYTKLRLKERGL